MKERNLCLSGVCIHVCYQPFLTGRARRDGKWLHRKEEGGKPKSSNLHIDLEKTENIHIHVHLSYISLPSKWDLKKTQVLKGTGTQHPVQDTKNILFNTLGVFKHGMGGSSLSQFLLRKENQIHIPCACAKYKNLFIYSGWKRERELKEYRGSIYSNKMQR